MAQQTQLREASARVFGNRYRAELLLALATSADERGVCLGDLAALLGAPASAYHAPVRALIELGLVTRAARAVGDRRRWYRRAGDPAWWNAARELLERLPDTVAVVAVG